MSKKKLKKKVKNLKRQNKHLRYQIEAYKDWLATEQKSHDATWCELEDLKESNKARLLDEIEDLAEVSEAVEPTTYWNRIRSGVSNDMIQEDGLDLGWNPDSDFEPTVEPAARWIEPDESKSMKSWIKKVKGRFKDEV